MIACMADLALTMYYNNLIQPYDSSRISNTPLNVNFNSDRAHFRVTVGVLHRYVRRLDDSLYGRFGTDYVLQQ